MYDSLYVSLVGTTFSYEPPQQMLWTIKYLGRKEGIELRKEIYLYVSSSQKHLWEVVHKTPNMRMFLSVPLALYWTAEWLSEHQGIQPQLLDIIHLRYRGGHQTGTGTPSLLGYSSVSVFTLLRPSPDWRGRVYSERCLGDADLNLRLSSWERGCLSLCKLFKYLV